MGRGLIESKRTVKSPEAFRTISEVSSELGIPQHVLRFWESKFPQVRPLKRGGGRRYYRPEDIEIIRKIRSLLHDEGYTIRGVQKVLGDEIKRQKNGEPQSSNGNLAGEKREVLESILKELTALHGSLVRR